MTPLQTKIRATTLFSPTEKVDIILALEQMTDEKKSQLEAVIDEYDAKHKTLVTEFVDESKKDLTMLEEKAKDDEDIQKAANLMKQGLEEIQNPTASLRDNSTNNN
jgi:hypothetical protein